MERSGTLGIRNIINAALKERKRRDAWPQKIVAAIEIALEPISIPSASGGFCRSFRAAPSFIVTQGSATLPWAEVYRHSVAR